MAQNSSGGSGGMQLLYGVWIDQALKAKGTSIEELKLLREQTHAAVEAQGNLVEALQALDKELEKRGAKPDTSKGAVRSVLVQIFDIDVPRATSQRLEERCKAAALEELGKLDLRGDLATTPISDVRAFGLGGGGHTGGAAIRLK
jgi:hypothetical protein